MKNNSIAYIDEIYSRLKNISLEPAIKVLPPREKKSYVKQSNIASLSGYDSVGRKYKSITINPGINKSIEKGKT